MAADTVNVSTALVVVALVLLIVCMLVWLVKR